MFEMFDIQRCFRGKCVLGGLHRTDSL